MKGVICNFKVASLFSNIFENAVNSLGIKKGEQCNEIYGLRNPVKNAIKKFKQHQSINLLKENVPNPVTSNFISAEINDIIKIISNLYNEENITFNDLPKCRLKGVSNICGALLASFW